MAQSAIGGQVAVLGHATCKGDGRHLIPAIEDDARWIGLIAQCSWRGGKHATAHFALPQLDDFPLFAARPFANKSGAAAIGAAIRISPCTERAQCGEVASAYISGMQGVYYAGICTRGHLHVVKVRHDFHVVRACEQAVVEPQVSSWFCGCEASMPEESWQSETGGAGGEGFLR
jgi:hypothetical protein